MDIGVSALALALLAPVLVLIAAWVRLDSPGPALYRQTRVGRHGVPFQIHKFRTMQVRPVDGVQITVGDDPRITRAGRFLRRSKLDELPQLWDVLRGAMSLVGPRPEVPRYVALYPGDLREKVLSVRPGITDFASIEYRDEGSILARAADPEREYLEVILPAKLRYAARYVEECSMATDLTVLAATLRSLVFGR